MRRDREDSLQVAMRLVIAVAVTALGVLFLSGNAYPKERAAAAAERVASVQEPVDLAKDGESDLARADRTARTQALLLSFSQTSPEEHASQAREILRRESRARWTSVGYALVEVALDVATGISPRGIVSSARKLYRAAWRPRAQRTAEERALARVEPEILSGSTSPSVVRLQRQLQHGQLRRAAARRLDLAERALQSGDLGLARRQLQRARSLDPALGVARWSQHGLPRLLEAREELSRIPAPLVRTPPIRATTRSDTHLAGLLLLGIGPRVGELEGDLDPSPDALLATAVVSYLAGDAESALGTLRRLAKREGSAAAVARRALADPQLNVTQVLARARSRRRFDRALVWLGGRDLEAHGRRISPAGIRAWQSALDPVNLVIGIPARVLRGDDAPDGELRRAAERYLEVQRTGPGRLRVESLLDRLETASPRGAERAAFVDGRLVLHRARTFYVPLTARMIGVERSLFESRGAGTPLLASLPKDAEGAWILPVPLAEAMPREAARRIVLRLAERLEAGDVAVVGAPRSEASERLRRLESTLDRGDLGLAMRPWLRTDPRPLEELPRALADRGRPSAESALSAERRRRKLLISRELSGGPRCPHRAVCLERTRSFQSQATATLSDDGSLLLATRARLGGLAFSLELDDALPRATLSIPFGRWLGVGAWLPAGARLGAHVVIGLDGISIGPVLPGPDAAFDEVLTEGS